MVQQNRQEETLNSENPLQGGNNQQGVKISVVKLKANRESLNRQNQQMTLKPAKTSRRVQLCPFWLKPFFTRNVERMLFSSVPSFAFFFPHVAMFVPSLPLFFPSLSFLCLRGVCHRL